MAEISSLFVTRLYRAKLNELAKKTVSYDELQSSCLAIAEDDEAGQKWCEKNGYPGYTSYSSLNDLPWRFPIFGALERRWTSMSPPSARTSTSISATKG